MEQRLAGPPEGGGSAGARHRLSGRPRSFPVTWRPANLERRAWDSNPQLLSEHHISSVAANHSLTLQTHVFEAVYIAVYIEAGFGRSPWGANPDRKNSRVSAENVRERGVYPAFPIVGIGLRVARTGGRSVAFRIGGPCRQTGCPCRQAAALTYRPTPAIFRAAFCSFSVFRHSHGATGAASAHNSRRGTQSPREAA